MGFRFTRHAKEKLNLMKSFGFLISRKQIINTIRNPMRIEEKKDGTFIASTLMDRTHLLRVVYRVEGDIMVIITFYPARRKTYGI